MMPETSPMIMTRGTRRTVAVTFDIKREKRVVRKPTAKRITST